MTPEACDQEAFVDTTIQIRAAVPADAEAIGHVARAAWNATYRDIILPENRERLLSRWYSPQAIRDSIDRENSWFYVAIAGDALVGFAQYVVRKDGAGQLTRIYVLSEWQRKTVGTSLLQAGLAALSDQGARQVLVEVEKDNQAGKAFYEKNGFGFSREFSLELPEQELAIQELVLQMREE